MLDCENIYASNVLNRFLKPDIGHFQNKVAQLRYSVITMHKFKKTLGH